MRQEVYTLHTKVDFRLRKELDADLIRATSHLNKGDLNQLCKDGLRLMLGICTTRKSMITEQPILQPKTIPSKPAVFIPKRKDDVQ